MLEISYRLQDFYGFYRGEVRSNRALIEWERDVNVLVNVVRLQKQQSRADMRNEAKSISI